MPELISMVGAAATNIFTNIGEVASITVSQPILLLPAAAFMVGVSVKLFKRML